MLCSQTNDVAQKNEQIGLLIGKSDQLSIVYHQCKNTGPCSSLSLQFDRSSSESLGHRSLN